MIFLGTYADLTGRRIGNFLVAGLSGRDSAGAPCWRIVCDQCQYPQTLSHAKLAPLVQSRATQASIQCANPACPLSRQASTSETISEFRRRERREAAQAAIIEANDAAERNKETRRQRADDANLEAVRREYIRVWNHLIRTPIEESKIVTFDRWKSLSAIDRRMLLDRMNADPDCWFVL